MRFYSVDFYKNDGINDFFVFWLMSCQNALGFHFLWWATDRGMVALTTMLTGRGAFAFRWFVRTSAIETEPFCTQTFSAFCRWGNFCTFWRLVIFRLAINTFSGPSLVCLEHAVSFPEWLWVFLFKVVSRISARPLSKGFGEFDKIPSFPFWIVSDKVFSDDGQFIER